MLAIHKALICARNDVVELFLSVQPLLAHMPYFDCPTTHLALVLGGFANFHERCMACLDELLKRGASVEAVDRVGRSVLHWAAFYDMGELVGRLVEELDAAREDYGGMTPADICVDRDNVQTLTVLVPFPLTY